MGFFLLLIVTSAKMTMKKPRFGALPTLNMPKKSHVSATLVAYIVAAFRVSPLKYLVAFNATVQ